MPIGNARGKQIFREAGALIKGHFRLNGGLDGLEYVAKGELLKPGNEKYFEEICRNIAEDLSPFRLETIVGPRSGAVPYAKRVAEILTEMTGKKVEAVYAEKAQDGSKNFFIRKEDEQHIYGERCGLVEDVATSKVNGSGSRVVSAMRKSGGQVIVESVIWNRGEVTGDDVGVSNFISQINIPIPSYIPDPEGVGECPGCREGQRYHGELGHGKNLPADHPLSPL